jgi:quercetin dioxygenase-like cupin family protein
MATLVGFGTFAALPEEQISEKVSRRILSGDQGMIVWWSIGAGIHVEPHSHPNEQIVWMLKGRMEFRLGTERRVCGQGDVALRIPPPEHGTLRIGVACGALHLIGLHKRRERGVERLTNHVTGVTARPMIQPISERFRIVD